MLLVKTMIMSPKPVDLMRVKATPPLSRDSSRSHLCEEVLKSHSWRWRSNHHTILSAIMMKTTTTMMTTSS